MPWNPRETGVLSAMELLELEYKLLAQGKIFACLAVSLGSAQKDTEYRKLQIKAQLHAMKERPEPATAVESINLLPGPQQFDLAHSDGA